jgi:hypothetical protein
LYLRLVDDSVILNRFDFPERTSSSPGFSPGKGEEGDHCPMPRHQSLLTLAAAVAAAVSQCEQRIAEHSKLTSEVLHFADPTE